MTSLTLYGLKNCDTCKKALKTLAENGKKAIFVDIRAEADLANKVPTWLSAVSSEVLINRRSTTWRNLNEAERARAPEALLIEHPTLIKRPVIEAGKTVHIGWAKEVQATFA